MPRRCGSGMRSRCTRPIVGCRASIPSDKSFATFEGALAHVRGAALPEGTQLVWQQALLDVLLEAPIESAGARFSIRPRLERLGQHEVTALRFIDGAGA